MTESATPTDEAEKKEPEGEPQAPLVARVYLPLPTADLASLLSSIHGVFPGCSVKAVQPYQQDGYLEVRDTKEPMLVSQ